MQAHVRHSSSGHYNHQVYADEHGPLQETRDHSTSLPHLVHYGYPGGLSSEGVDRNWYRTASNEREGARTNKTVESTPHVSGKEPTAEDSQQINALDLNELTQRQAPQAPALYEVPAVRGGGGGGAGEGGVDLTVMEEDKTEADKGDWEEQKSEHSNPTSKGVAESEVENVHGSAWKTAGIVGWLTLLSLIYVVEVISDIATAVDLGIQGRFGTMAVCAAIVLIPAVLLALLSLGLYKRDDSYYISVDPNYERRFGAISVVMHCMLLGPIHRYIKVVMVAPIHKSQFYEHIKRDSDLIRYISLMLYTLPQLTLYFSLLLTFSAGGVPIPLTLTVSAIFSALSALLILWSFATNDMLSSREVRQILPAKVAILNWNIFIIAARIIALGAFASQFGLYVFVVAVVHWIVMWIWIAVQRPVLGEDGDSQSEEQGREENGGGNATPPSKLKLIIIKLFWVYYYFIAGMVQLFTFYNIKSGKTRYRLTFYYFLITAESLALILLYYFWWTAWPSPLIVTLECCTLAIGITWMLLYYSILHPLKTRGWTMLGIPPFCCPLCRSHDNKLDFDNASTGSAHDTEASSEVGASTIGTLDRLQPVTATQRYNNRFSTGSYNEMLNGSLSTVEAPAEPGSNRYIAQGSFVPAEQTREVSSPANSLPHSLPPSFPPSLLPPSLYNTGSVGNIRRENATTIEITV